jgi:sugar lactone lactonase YvrE
MQELATGYGLIEGPVWDAANGLYFSDVLGGGIHLLSRKDKVSLAVPKRRGVGGMALQAGGGLVAGGRDIVHVSLADHSMKVLLDQKTADDAVGFNDLTTDSGSLTRPRSTRLGDARMARFSYFASTVRAWATTASAIAAWPSAVG